MEGDGDDGGGDDGWQGMMDDEGWWSKRRKKGEEKEREGGGQSEELRTDEWVCQRTRRNTEESGKRAEERKNPMDTEGDMYQHADTKITQWKSGRVESGGVALCCGPVDLKKIICWDMSGPLSFSKVVCCRLEDNHGHGHDHDHQNTIKTNRQEVFSLRLSL